jgi:hypothetical protein
MLEEYLKEIYPKASKRKIKYYDSLIESGDSEKLPPTKEMLRLEFLKRREAEIKAELETVRTKVIEQKERTGHSFQGFSIKKIHQKKFIPDAFYDWVSTIVDPELLETLTVRTIDENKFIKLEANGIVEYDELPDNVFKPSSHYRVEAK